MPDLTVDINRFILQKHFKLEFTDPNQDIPWSTQAGGARFPQNDAANTGGPESVSCGKVRYGSGRSCRFPSGGPCIEHSALSRHKRVMAEAIPRPLTAYTDHDISRYILPNNEPIHLMPIRGLSSARISARDCLTSDEMECCGGPV